jgi:hypothetical protein
MRDEDRHRPDFLYIGTSKAGSTWLFNVLARHPDVFLASNKGLYYFDAHFDRGADWYLGHFRGTDGSDGLVRGEVSHSYLSSPQAPERIAALAPGVRLLVCLREPVDRAFSDYLDLRKNQQFDGPFPLALEQYPRLLDRGHYATHLRRYLEVFPREQLLVQLFDDLKADPQAYADRVFDFLGVPRVVLPPSDLRSRMPAGVPRNNAAAAAAKSASQLVKRAGLRQLRSRVKRSALVRQALYRPYADDRPVLDADTASRLRGHFAPEVAELDRLLDLSLASRWEYEASDGRSAVG